MENGFGRRFSQFLGEVELNLLDARLIEIGDVHPDDHQAGARGRHTEVCALRGEQLSEETGKLWRELTKRVVEGSLDRCIVGKSRDRNALHLQTLQEWPEESLDSTVSTI